MEKSILYPILIETGDIIMHIDPTQVSSDINKSVQEGADNVNEFVDEKIKENAQEMIDEVKENIEEK
jgi:hypothetical protein